MTDTIHLPDPSVTERTPLIPNHPTLRTAERVENKRSTSPVNAATATFTKEHLRTFSGSVRQQTPSPYNLTNPSNNYPAFSPPTNTSFSKGVAIVGAAVRGGVSKPTTIAGNSDGVLAIRSKQSKVRARKNVGAFRRKRQDYATWKGRIGVHVEVDEFDLKLLLSKIYLTLSRVGIGESLCQFRSMEDNVPLEGGCYEIEEEGEIHASMPEVFVFGFGAMVFWDFWGEEMKKQWMEQHLFLHKDVMGLHHNAESNVEAYNKMDIVMGIHSNGIKILFN